VKTGKDFKVKRLSDYHDGASWIAPVKVSMPIEDMEGITVNKNKNSGLTDLAAYYYNLGYSKGHMEGYQECYNEE